MSLPRTAVLYTTGTAVFVPLSPTEMAEMNRQGFFQDKQRIYQMEYMSKVLQVECPVLRRSEADEPGVVLSSIKLPHRPYPSHVYLLALLLTLIGLSMRKAAVRSRTLFGLSSFCHSTISRLTSRLYAELPLLLEWQPPEPQGEAATRSDLPQPRPAALRQAVIGTSATGPGHGLHATFMEPKLWRKPRPGLAVCLFRLLEPMLRDLEYGNRLVHAFGQRFERLLL